MRAAIVSLLVLAGCGGYPPVPGAGAPEGVGGQPPDADADTDADGFPAGPDCDDSLAGVHPGAVELCGDGVDQDCDGGDLACPIPELDADADGSLAGADCDDSLAGVHPGAVELCGDGVDQDCNGADLPCPAEETDVDQDGFPAGADCHDGLAGVHPGAVEVCGDGVDQDCDGADLACPIHDPDVDDDGFPAGADCDDQAPGVFPGARELCGDGIDQDCSGADLVCADADGDADGYPAGVDCNDARADISPGARELCDDGVDQDCSGADLACAGDLDRDGHASVAEGGDDCDDLRVDVHPGAPEVPLDGTDQNCDGSDALYGGPFFGIGTGAADYWPVVASAGGRYLVAWARNPIPGAASTEIVVVALDSSGVALAPEQTVQTVAVEAWGTVPLQLASDGAGFLLAWGDPATVHTQLLDLDGVPVGLPIALDEDGDQDTYPTVAAIPGSYLVSWRWIDNRGPQTRGQELRAIDAATGALSPVQAFDQLDGSLVLSSDGSQFFVVYTLDGGRSYSVRRYDSNATALGSDFVLLTGASEYGPVLGYDGAQFLAAVTRSFWGVDVRRHLFSPTGQLVDPADVPGPIVSDALGEQRPRKVLSLRSGWYVIFADSRWSRSPDPGRETWAYYGQRLAPDGTPAGTLTGFNQGILYEGSGWGPEPAFATDGDRVLVIWSRAGTITGMWITP